MIAGNFSLSLLPPCRPPGLCHCPENPQGHVKEKKEKLKPVRGICWPLGSNLAGDELIKLVTKIGRGSGGEGPPGSCLGAQRTQAGSSEEGWR